MKSLFILSLIPVIAHAQTQTVTWQTRMVQSQIRGATGTPELVAESGTRPSLPIGPDGSRFELWGWKFTNGVLTSETSLANTEVGTYLPSAQVSVSSSDPYAAFRRSRVDQPFTVQITVSNLKASTTGAPEASQKVFVEHHADLYTLGNYDGSSIASTRRVTSFFISQNGTTTYSFPLTNITAPDLVKRAGKERFIVYALADGAVPMRQIAAQDITMYPLVEGGISGLDDSSKVYRTLPEFTATVWRPYPTSSTWVEIYDGDFAANKRGSLLPGTLETPGHIVPPAIGNLVFRDLPEQFQPSTNGKKTMVLRSSSPFPGESTAQGGRILASKTIQVGNTIAIKAMVTTLE